MISKLKTHHRRFLLPAALHHRRRLLPFCTTSAPAAHPPLPDELRFRNPQSANDHICNLCNRRLHREALHAFQSLQLRRPTFRLYPSTYAHLVLACSGLGDLAHGRWVHRHLVDSGVPLDVILCNHMLNMYGKCGALEYARELFEGMPARNLVSWTSMISGYSQNKREREAMGLYIEMLDSGVFPDEFTLGSVVRACSALVDDELGQQLHCHVIKSEKGADRIVQNALVSMYSKLGRIAEASVVFTKIRNKDLISWGSMIAGHAQQGLELEALDLFKEMLSIGAHHPNEFLFGSVFSACGALRQLGCGEELHGLCLKFGWAGDSCAGCSLTDMYAKCGKLDSARKAFYQIDSPDSIAWNSIISAFAYEGDPNEAMFFFSEMRDSGAKPDDLTVRCLLCAFKTPLSFVQGQVVHSYIVKIGFCTNLEVCNTLLAMYTKCSDISLVFDLFKEMNSKDFISWNTILTACLQHNQLEEVFRLLKPLNEYGCKLDQITLNILLSACSELAYLEMGYQIHSYALKVGLEADLMITNGLIDTYAKCGSLEDAGKLFMFVGNKYDVVLWSSLIVGYAQSGYGKEALDLFNDMKRLGIRPNHVTFVGVLSACSHVGLIDEGRHYFEKMESDYGVLPTREHYSCMVDLFARAGQLREAEAFINKMPFQPDVVVWKTLLASCRAQGNLEIGQRAAEGILRLDPFNSAAHVLLCNIYASAGRWHEFAELRKSMKTNGITKVPGKSWIKVNGHVRVFTVEDKSHPETEDMYRMLRELWWDMTEAGYKALTTWEMA
ncbi:hypothetical protein Taro_049872 [Colocasia esculenta]|uniref:Uncharacterized protein n=1 Tax=Colocasia esculenta TaxID=4460 RepID=A0A843XCB7_COLES|nr:hypothetical protein [Colocasia esculenta]